MKTYRYHAIDAKGRHRRGVLAAQSVDELELRVAQMGLDLISSRENRSLFRLLNSRVSRRELIQLLFHIEQLITAGVPLLETLMDLQLALPEGELRNSLAEIISQIQSGSRFSEALAAHPMLFEPIFVGMIRVGEESGRLDSVLRDMIAMFRQQDELIAHAKRIAIYPLVVGSVITAVVLFLMVYLVPQLTAFVDSTGSELPLHSRLLFALSEWIAAYWLYGIGGLLTVPMAIKLLAARSELMALLLDRWALQVWLIGPLKRQIKLARFATYLALMYRSGITLLDGIALSAEVVDNRHLQRLILSAHRRIVEGEGIAESFAAVAIFPPLVVRMVRSGEQSGTIEQSLARVSDFYRREVQEAIDRIEPSIEPLLTVILGLIMGWIVLAVIAPIYDAVLLLEGG